MKWEVKTITPLNNAKKASRAFSLQVYIFCKPKKKIIEKFEDHETFTLQFEGTHKEYIRTSAIVDKFNMDMQTILEGRVFRYGSKDWKPSYKKWVIDTFYTNPATIKILEQPTQEEYTMDEKGMFKKIKEKLLGEGNERE